MLSIQWQEAYILREDELKLIYLSVELLFIIIKKIFSTNKNLQESQFLTFCRILGVLINSAFY